MRRLLAATLLVPLAVTATASAAAPGRPADIRKTTDVVVRTDEAHKGEILKALAHLVVIAGDIAKDGRVTGPARAKLDTAVEKSAKGTPLDPVNVSAVSEAYAALNGGRPFAFPADVKSLDGARTLVRSLAEKSIKALEAGRPEEAARDLLGCVLAVTTPMEAGP